MNRFANESNIQLTLLLYFSTSSDDSGDDNFNVDDNDKLEKKVTSLRVIGKKGSLAAPVRPE